MDLLQDTYSYFWIVKRSFLKKSLRFIREEDIDWITEEKRWNVAALLLTTRAKVANSSRKESAQG